MQPSLEILGQTKGASSDNYPHIIIFLLLLFFDLLLCSHDRLLAIDPQNKVPTVQSDGGISRISLDALL